MQAEWQCIAERNCSMSLIAYTVGNLNEFQ